MLETGPPVHRDRAELDLDLHEPFLIVQEDGGLHDQVQAAVAVGLGVCDIVFAFDERNIILAQQRVGQFIDVRRVRADDAHARDVVEVLLDALHRQGVAAAGELFHDALRGFETGLDRFDGVAVVLQGQLLVEHVELGLHLHDRAAIVAHQLAVRLEVFLDPLLHLAAGEAGEQHLLERGAVHERTDRHKAISSFVSLFDRRAFPARSASKA